MTAQDNQDSSDTSMDTQKDRIGKDNSRKEGMDGKSDTKGDVEMDEVSNGDRLGDGMGSVMENSVKDRVEDSSLHGNDKHRNHDGGDVSLNDRRHDDNTNKNVDPKITIEGASSEDGSLTSETKRHCTTTSKPKTERIGLHALNISMPENHWSRRHRPSVARKDIKDAPSPVLISQSNNVQIFKGEKSGDVNAYHFPSSSAVKESRMGSPNHSNHSSRSKHSPAHGQDLSYTSLSRQDVLARNLQRKESRHGSLTTIEMPDTGMHKSYSETSVSHSKSRHSQKKGGLKHRIKSMLGLDSKSSKSGSSLQRSNRHVNYHYGSGYVKDVPLSSDEFINEEHSKTDHYGIHHRYNSMSSPPSAASDGLEIDIESSSSHRSNSSQQKKHRYKNLIRLVDRKPDHQLHSETHRKQIKKGKVSFSASPGGSKTFIFGLGFEVVENDNQGMWRRPYQSTDSLDTMSQAFDDENQTVAPSDDEEDPRHKPSRKSTANMRRNSKSHRSLTNLLRPLSVSRALNRLSNNWHGDDHTSGNATRADVKYFEGAKRLPTEMKQFLGMYKGSSFHFSLTSSLLLYDRWAFLLKGNYAKKKVTNSSLFEFERRRAINDSLTLLIEDDYTCSVRRTSSKTHKNENTSGGLGDMFQTVRGSFLHKHEDPVDDPCFIDNDSCYDIEQIKIETLDPDLVKHMILCLHFDAPTLAFAHRPHVFENMRGLHLLSMCIPKIRPYIRVIDVNDKREVLRYHIDRSAELSVAMELNLLIQNQFKADRLVYECIHNQENAFHTQYRSKSHLNLAGDKDSETKEEAESEALSNPSSDSDSSGGSDISYQEIDVEQTKQKLNETEQMMQWQIIPLKEQFHFQTHFGMSREDVLAKFLFLSNENQFGTKAIPKPLPDKFFVTVQQCRNVFAKSSKHTGYYCIVQTDSAHETEKKHTKLTTVANNTLVWNEEFSFLVMESGRSSSVVIEVWRRNRFAMRKLIGTATFPFGDIRRRTSAHGAQHTQWCPMFLRGRQTGEVLLTIQLYWQPKLSISDRGDVIVVNE